MADSYDALLADLDTVEAANRNPDYGKNYYPTGPASLTYDSLLSDLDKVDAVKKQENKPGFFKEIGGTIAGGLIDTAESYSRAGRGVYGGERAGGYGDEDGLMTRAIEWAKEYKKQNPSLDQDPQRSGVSRWVHEGIRSATQSIASGVPGAIIGGKLGAMVGTALGPGVGTIAGGVLGAIGGYALNVGTVFGLSEYDSFLEEAKKAGISEAEAEIPAIRAGTYEGGIEFIQGLIEGRLFGAGKALGVVGKEGLKKALGSVFKVSGREWIKRQAGTVGIETGGEMLTGGLQSEERAALGMGKDRFIDGAIDAFGPALVASLIFGSLGAVGSRLVRSKIKRDLVDPGVTPEERLMAAKEVYNSIRPTDKAVADKWYETAQRAIQAGQTIDIETPIDSDPVLDKKLAQDKALGEQAVKEAIKTAPPKGQQPVDDISAEAETILRQAETGEVDPEDVLTGRVVPAEEIPPGVRSFVPGAAVPPTKAPQFNNLLSSLDEIDRQESIKKGETPPSPIQEVAPQPEERPFVPEPQPAVPGPELQAPQPPPEAGSTYKLSHNIENPKDASARQVIIEIERIKAEQKKRERLLANKDEFENYIKDTGLSANEFRDLLNDNYKSNQQRLNLFEEYSKTKEFLEKQKEENLRSSTINFKELPPEEVPPPPAPPAPEVEKQPPKITEELAKTVGESKKFIENLIEYRPIFKNLAKSPELMSKEDFQLMGALTSTEGDSEKLLRIKERGATDEELKQFLGEHLGQGGGSSFGGYGYKGGKNPIVAFDSIMVSKKNKGKNLSGSKLVNTVRDLIGIGQPSDTKITTEAPQAAKATEAAPEATPAPKGPVQRPASLNILQERHIRGRIDKLGSLEAVNKAYSGDSTVEKYARALAQEKFAGQAAAPVEAPAPVAVTPTAPPITEKPAKFTGTIGRAWVGDQQRNITAAKEITRGKRKGWFLVTFTDGKTKNLPADAISQMPMAKEAVPTAPEAVEQQKAKEPWEMTFAEYEAIEAKKQDEFAKSMPKKVRPLAKYARNPDARFRVRKAHEDAVRVAIRLGKPVPESVLSAYPDLEKKTVPKTPPPPATPKGKPGEKATTLRGAIKAMGGINFLNFKGEKKDMPSVVRMSIIRTTGEKIDLAENRLKEDGWLRQDENLLDVLRNPKNLTRNKVAGEGIVKREQDLNEQEKRVKREMEHEAEAPPEGDYITMSAEDLPEGKKLTIIDDRAKEGWDVYEVTEKDPFGVTLKDGKAIELKPGDKIQVRREDLPEKEKPSLVLQGEKQMPKTQAEMRVKGKKEGQAQQGGLEFGRPETPEALTLKGEKVGWKEAAQAKKIIEAEKATEAPAGEKIEDFGEKIGGARKDIAERGYAMTKPTKKEDSEPAWKKKFHVVESVKEPGTWSIVEHTKDRWGFTGSSQKFASQEEVEKALPIFAVSRKFSPRQNKSGTWEIEKKVGDRKRLVVTQKEFPSREEAMKYMATNAEALLETKTSFGEEILPVPDDVKRKGVERRTGPATREMFIETFAPRAIEFGNWQNQEERQLVMNHAYDGLLDLADALGVPPKALMLDGELAIAFGARGQGLTGAKAHYERDYGIINLTKMKGAGSLAHEWMHAFDHHLARIDTKAKRVKIPNERGDLVYPDQDVRYQLQSHGASYKSEMRKELKDSYNGLIETMLKKGEQYVEDTQVADKFLSVAREQVQSQIDKVRSELSEDQTKYHHSKGGYSKKPIRYFEPAAAEKLAEFDRLASIIVEGGDLNKKWVQKDSEKKGSLAGFGGHYSNDTVDAISKILKDVRNHNGFRRIGNQNVGLLDRLMTAIDGYSERLKMFEDAKAGTEKTKQVPTRYAIEARKMDQARSGDYWSEPHEMAARAFASYVEDKIAEKGGQSDFLVYHAHGGIILPMIDGFVARPYPEGKERTAINQAFDKFIKTLEVKETEKGVTLARVGEEATKAPTARAIGLQRANVDRIKQLVPFVQRAMKQAGLSQDVIDLVKIDLKPIIDLQGKDIEQTLADWAKEGKSASQVLGATTMRKWSALVELSTEQDLNSLEKTAFHESFHIAAKWLLPESDYKRLMSHYRTEEGAAEAFADFVSRRSGGQPAPVGAVRRAFLKLRNLFNQVRTFLKGQGITNPEDIFGRLAAGEYAPHFDAWGQGETTTALQAEQRAAKWYSQMEKFLSEKLPASGTAKSYMAPIESWAKKGEFKAEELEWSGLKDWLNQQSGKVTKQEVLDYLAANNVRVQEVVKTEQGSEKHEKIMRDINHPQMRTKALTEGMTQFAAGKQDTIKAAYDKLKSERGYSNIEISDIRDRAGMTQKQIEKFIKDPANVEKYGISLSIGDWSLSPESTRSGVITFEGDKSDFGQPRRYLLMKISPPANIATVQERNYEIKKEGDIWRVYTPIGNRVSLEFDSQDLAQNWIDTRLRNKGLISQLRLGRREEPTASVFDEVAPVHAQEQLKRAFKGVDTGPVLDKIKVKASELVKTFTPGREYLHLEPKFWGKAINSLRGFKDAGNYGKKTSELKLREILDPIIKLTAKDKAAGKRAYEAFTLKIALEDLTRELSEGGKYADWEGLVEKHGSLQFGFRSADEVAETLRKVDAIVEGNPTVKDALERRDRITRNVLQDVVNAKLLPEDVLKDPRYFHHQVLEYLNENYSAGTGAGSFQVGRKGYQRSRIENIKNFSLNYLQSEFEVLAHQLTQLQRKKYFDRVDQEYNISKELQQQAKRANYVAVVGGQENMNRIEYLRGQIADLRSQGRLDADEKKILKEWAAEIRELDPTMPFRQRMAIGFSKLSKVMGLDVDEFGDVDSVDMAELAQLANSTDETVSIPARSIFKAMGERNAFIQDTLGRNYLTAAYLARDRKPLDGSTGWTEYVPNPRSAWYTVGSIQDATAQQIMAGSRELQESDIRPVLARGRDDVWIIPNELAQTLEGKEFDVKAQDENVISRFSEKTLNAWKRWVLMNPMRIAKYNLNNLSGDADITFAYDPKILKEIPQAARDLWRWHYNKEMSPALKAEFDKALEHDGISSGLTAKDIPDISDQAGLKAITQAVGADSRSALRYIENFWQGSKNFTAWRENVLRLAAARHFEKQIRAGKKVYGASEQSKVDAATDIDEKKWILSRDLVGDYGAISPGGQWLRRKLIPFYSWWEVNAPRYYRLYKNLAVEGQPEGRRLRMGAVAAKQTATLSAKVFAMYAAAQMFNHLVWPDEEEELGEVGRRQAHVILGRREDGSIITVRLQGALSDALSWMGLEDFPEDIRQLASGKKTVGKFATEAALAPVQKLVQGTRPEFKGAAELLTGKALYPDFTKPRPIRDKAEHIAQMLSADSIYRRAAGKPLRGGTTEQRVLSDLLSVFTYSAEPGEVAYYKSRDLVNEFLKEHNLERPISEPTNRMNALYYYKQAIKLGDAKAAEKYLEEYKTLGGKQKDIQMSVKRAHPLGSLPNKERARFFNSLDTEDRQTVKRGSEWYRETFKGGV